jgi:rubrerythrin
MENEFADLLDTAIYKEIASEALYSALKEKTSDPGARALMENLAEQEKMHARRLTDIKDKGYTKDWHHKVAKDLKIGEYLTAPDNLEGVGLQDTLVFAIKREQKSIEFYSKMTGLFRTQSAKNLCNKLAKEELSHKIRLEIIYDDLFLGDD